jgi:hypothetical protein
MAARPSPCACARHRQLFGVPTGPVAATVCACELVSVRTSREFNECVWCRMHAQDKASLARRVLDTYDVHSRMPDSKPTIRVCRGVS